MILYKYNYWARDRILSVVNQLEPSQVVAPNMLTYGSIDGALRHILNVECLWRSRCQHRISPRKLQFEKTFDDLQELQRAWKEEEFAMLNFINELDEIQLNESIKYIGQGGNEYENILWQILIQLINHGTHHRSEIAAKLAELGKPAGDFDFIIYLRGR